MARKIKPHWTCSNDVHHEHRWYWTAWLCGRVQWFWHRYVARGERPVADDEKPLACPFCGTSPLFDNTDAGWLIQCAHRKCGVQPMVCNYVKQDALDAWNRRCNPLPWW